MLILAVACTSTMVEHLALTSKAKSRETASIQGFFFSFFPPQTRALNVYLDIVYGVPNWTWRLVLTLAVLNGSLVKWSGPNLAAEALAPSLWLLEGGAMYSCDSTLCFLPSLPLLVTVSLSLLPSLSPPHFLAFSHLPLLSHLGKVASNWTKIWCNRRVPVEWSSSSWLRWFDNPIFKVRLGVLSLMCTHTLTQAHTQPYDGALPNWQCLLTGL